MKVIINDVEYIEKPLPITPPTNNVGATHWAILPDDRFVFFKLSDDALVWLPLSGIWIPVNTVPYTLHCYDDYGD